MTVGLSPYPRYRGSGLTWLGEIPAHWEVRRNGRLFAQRVEIGFPDLPVLEVSLNTGVRVRDTGEGARKQVMSDFGGYKRAAKGDLAYNTMRMWQGAVGVAPTDGLISPAYVVARPLAQTEGRYYGYLFRTAAYMDEVNKFSRGIVSDRNRLYWEEFKQMPSAFPPPEEQRKIADFLDDHGEFTRRLVSTKLRLIERLGEQGQAMTHHAVTGGLAPHAPTKPTGLNWLPQIPEHWTLLKLKLVSKKIVGGSTPPSGRPECWDGDLVWVTPEDVSKTKSLKDSARRITERGLASCSAVLVPAGSVVVTSRAPVGNVAVAAIELSTNQGCKALVPRLDVLDPGFAYYLLGMLKPELQSLAKGTTFDEISTFALSQIPVPVPPVDEQRTITASILAEWNSIDKVVDRTYREIELVREYRTRLISEVITGKLDVRGILSEEPTPVAEPDVAPENRGKVPPAENSLLAEEVRGASL